MLSVIPSPRRGRRERSAILSLLGILLGCTPLVQQPADYLDRAVGRENQTQIHARLGPPLMQIPADRGGVVWVYRYAGVRDTDRNSMQQLWCYEDALTFGSDKVLQGWRRQDCLSSEQVP